MVGGLEVRLEKGRSAIKLVSSVLLSADAVVLVKVMAPFGLEVTKSGSSN